MTIEHWISIIQAISGYAGMAMSIFFLHCFYDTGFVWSTKKAVLLFILTIIKLIGNLMHLSFVNVICLIAYYLIGIYDYSGKKLIGAVRFIVTCNLIQDLCVTVYLIVASCMIPELNLLSLLLAVIENNDRTLLYELSLYGSIFMALYFVTLSLVLYFKVYRHGVVIKCGKRESLLLCGYLVILLSMIGCIVSTRSNSIDFVTYVGVFLAIIGLLPPIFIFAQCISSYYHNRTKLQEVYLQSELEHFRQYMHAQEETRRFRHDIRNNLLCMNEMISSGDHEQLTQYLKDMVEITDSLSFKYVTGDMLLDSILNSKAQVMEQQGIRFELDGVLAGGLPWKPMDICAVFANAIDNAIEACQKVEPEQRHISMHMKSTPQFWLITIENSVAKAVDTKKLFQKNGGYTSKSDSSRHGIGTYSMKQTLESYGAILEAKCTDQVFTLEIMIDKSK